MRFFYSLIASLLFFLVDAEAQIIVSGHVTNENAQPMALVNVAFLSPSDSTVVTGTVTRDGGEFQTIIAKGSYLIRFSYLGYETLYQPLEVEESLSIPTVTMTPLAVSLNDVVIKGAKPVFQMEQNALIAHVENDRILSRQNTLQDMLEMLPGVIRKDGAIELAGNGVPSYYINGRKIIDPSEIENLQVDQVKSVKIVTSHDVRYEGNKAVIDIRTKRLGEGLAFNLTGNYLQGIHPNQNYGISGSYNVGKWDYFLAYDYKNAKNRHGSDNMEQNLSDTVWTKNSATRSLDYERGHHYKAGFTYHIHPESELNFQYIGNTNKEGLSSSSFFNLGNDKEPGKLLEFDSQRLHATHTQSHHVNLNYTTPLNEKLGLEIFADYVKKHENTRYFLNEQQATESTAWNYLEKSDYDILAAHSVLSKELKKGQFQLGYDFSYTTGSEHLSTLQALHTGKTTNKEMKNALFAKYSLPLGHWSLNAGLRYELVALKQSGDFLKHTESYNESKLLPTLGFSYMKGFLMQNFSYAYDFERPSYTDMTGNTIYTSRFTAEKGNISLKTSTYHELSYMLLYKFLMAQVQYSYIYDPLLTNYYAPQGNSSVIISQMQNFKDMQELHLVVNLHHNVGCWSPSATFMYVRNFFTQDGPYGTTLKPKRPMVFLDLSSTFTLPKNFTFNTTLNYTFKGEYQMVSMTKPYYALNLSLKKSFANDRWRLSLDAKDILDTNHMLSNLFMSNVVNKSLKDYRESRMLGLTLTYRFRSSKEQENNSAASKELSRIKMSE